MTFRTYIFSLFLLVAGYLPAHSQITFFHDSYESPNDGVAGPTFSPSPLANGTTFQLTIEGTYSVWGPAQWTGIQCGFPESAPLFPSSGGNMTGTVGIDMEYIFSVRPGSCGGISTFPQANSSIEISLDGGTTWAHPGFGPQPYNSNHIYTYQITGQGHPIGIRRVENPTSDNYGQFKLTLNPVSSIVPTLSQWGLILLGFLILCVGGGLIWKRRHSGAVRQATYSS